MTGWKAYLDDRKEQSLQELLELLRIPSISALPERSGDVQRAAEWVAQRLRTAGMEHVEIMPTGGHPVVYGEWLHAEGKPTVLIYGHFDVQPVDPVDLWTSSPFDPEVRDGRIYARGASDMKGNLLITVLAVEALLNGEGALPVNVKFFLEGQEEIGSPQLPQFVPTQRDRFACDLVVSADGGQWSEDQPVLLIALKGGCGVEIDVRGPNTDLHSGIYGGGVANPIHALVRILDSMRSPDGKMLVDGFFDDVALLTDDEREQIAQIPFDEGSYKQSIGIPDVFGEPGFSTLERVWARPTLEINGIWGGFQGAGVKTVLPSEAHAKITCRLVPNQDPSRIVELLVNHVRRNSPPGVTVDAHPLPFVAKPYTIAADHWGNEIARSVLTEVYGKEPYQVRLGGSIPVCETFLTNLGAYTVDFGFGMEDEKMHAPDEFWRISSFDTGLTCWARLLQELGKAQPV